MFRIILFSSCIQSQICCIRCLRDVFTHKDVSVSTPFIHALGPRVFHILTHISDSSSSESSIEKHVLDVVLESLTVVHLLVDLAEQSEYSVFPMTQFLIRIALSFRNWTPQCLHSDFDQLFV
jgi:hypothetical protein